MKDKYSDRYIKKDLDSLIYNLDSYIPKNDDYKEKIIKRYDIFDDSGKGKKGCLEDIAIKYSNINSNNISIHKDSSHKDKDDIYNPTIIATLMQALGNKATQSTRNYTQHINPNQPIQPITAPEPPREREPIAYIQPTEEEIQRILDAVHYIQSLPDDLQKQLVEATREIRFMVDGSIRGIVGATRHYNAIRALNNPEKTDVSDTTRTRRSQLAGEEFFGINRYMSNLVDIADIQWWAVYKNGSWTLQTWNSEGEHLDTGLGGWGDLVGSIIKVNGRVLTPEETIAFYRTLKLRNERGFISQESQQTLQQLMKFLDSGETLPTRFEEQLELCHDLGLIEGDGRSLTYVGRSLILPQRAIQRKERQRTETDPQVRKLILPHDFSLN